ncbi:DUF5357 family protein [Trichothermofontia sp.]
MKNIIQKLKKIDDFLKKKVDILIPPQTSSWQTFALVSIFSFLLSYLANARFLKFILETLGWIFAIISLHWWTFQNPKKVSIAQQFFIGPWLTGIFVCFVLFKGWLLDHPNLVLIYTAASWPLISVAIALWPKLHDPGVRFSESDSDPKSRQKIIDNRRDIMLLFLGNLLLSCWLRFYFIVEKWVALSLSDR